LRWATANFVPDFAHASGKGLFDVDALGSKFASRLDHGHPLIDVPRANRYEIGTFLGKHLAVVRVSLSFLQLGLGPLQAIRLGVRNPGDCGLRV
jgi:hypothetical protein